MLFRGVRRYRAGAQSGGTCNRGVRHTPHTSERDFFVGPKELLVLLNGGGGRLRGKVVLSSKLALVDGHPLDGGLGDPTHRPVVLLPLSGADPARDLDDVALSEVLAEALSAAPPTNHLVVAVIINLVLQKLIIDLQQQIEE